MTAGEKAQALSYCRELLMRHRPILALYANPRLPERVQHTSGLQHLQLNLEMREFTDQMNAFDYHIEPAANASNMRTAVQLYRPEVLALSAHGTDGHVLLETLEGRAELVSFDKLAGGLAEAFGDRRPQLCILMMCSSEQFGIELATRLGCFVIAWSSVVEDRAARSFLGGCIRQLGAYLAQHGRMAADATVVFEAGVAAFRASGFEVGDPQSQLHPTAPPPHAHGVRQPGCTGCFPSVHGVPVLLSPPGDLT